MHHLIKNDQRVDNDEWVVYDSATDTALPEYALLPVAFWKDHGAEMADSQLKMGAFVVENEDIEALLPFLAQLSVIAFRFEKFADGRGFSYARQLRSEYGFKGEIRAFGDILADQVNFLQRTGFDAFALRSEAEAEAALAIKDKVTVQYQSDAVQPSPLYRRRA